MEVMYIIAYFIILYIGMYYSTKGLKLIYHKCLILLRRRLCYIGSSLLPQFFIPFVFWNFSIVFSLCNAQFASFQVSAHLMSIFFVQIITTISSLFSLFKLVHKHGPAAGVIPVLIPLIPLYPSIR